MTWPDVGCAVSTRPRFSQTFMELSALGQRRYEMSELIRDNGFYGHCTNNRSWPLLLTTVRGQSGEARLMNTVEEISGVKCVNCSGVQVQRLTN